MSRSKLGCASSASIVLLLALAGPGCVGDDVDVDVGAKVQSVDPQTLIPTPPAFLQELRCQRTGPQIRCTATASGPISGFLAFCPLFPALVQGTDEARITLTYGSDRVLRSVREHHDQTGTVSSNPSGLDGLPFDAHYNASADVVQVTPFGVELGPITYDGLVANVVSGGAGVVLHDAGTIILGPGVLREGGPHDSYEGNSDALCDALCVGPFGLCNGTCTALQGDPQNCGACGHACGPAEQCQGGTCVADPCAADGTCIPACGFGDPDCFDACAMPDGMCRPECQPFDPDCGPGCVPFPDGVCNPMCAADPDCGSCFPPAADGVCPPGCEIFQNDPDCPCPPGADHCGGPGCVNLSFDRFNCGACGNVCAGGTTCDGGQCVACTSGDGVCAGDCRQQGDTDCPCATDGVCDPACGPMDDDCIVCFNPMPDGNCPSGCEALNSDPDCPCAAGTDRCPGMLFCTNLAFDPGNCGACGNVCGAGELCQGGACVAGPVCGPDMVCDPACPPGADPDCGLHCLPFLDGVCDPACAAIDPDCGMCMFPNGVCDPACGAADPDCGPQCPPFPDGVCEPACGAADPDCGACFDPAPDGICAPGCELFNRDPDCPCPAGTDHCGGPFCVDLAFDPANCGACGNACGAGSACDGGQCIACVSGDGVCANGCSQQGDTDCPCTADGTCDPACGAVDIDCQACFNPIPDGSCVPGCELFNSDPDCPCAAGTTHCPGAPLCTSLETDAGNCGACGNACGAGQSCSGGACVAGPSCGPDMFCDPGCPPGADPDCGPGVPCSADADCPAGFVCLPAMMVCVPG